MTAGRIWRAGAYLFLGFTLIGIYFWIRLPWAPHIDFDVTGFLWLVENFPKLVVGGGTLFAAGIAIYCWVQSNRFN